jgi:hypothetical protein
MRILAIRPKSFSLWCPSWESTNLVTPKGNFEIIVINFQSTLAFILGWRLAWRVGMLAVVHIFAQQ